MDSGSTRSVALACVAFTACVAEAEREQLDCSSPTEAHADGALRIGQQIAYDYVALEPRNRAELTLGPQGAWMVEPVLDLTAPPTVPSELCVELTARVEGGEEPEILHFAVSFEATDASTRRTRPLFLPVSFDLDAVLARSAVISASVSGHGIATEHTVAVTLADDR